jgi:hypothetical protein
MALLAAAGDDRVSSSCSSVAVDDRVSLPLASSIIVIMN